VQQSIVFHILKAIFTQCCRYSKIQWNFCYLILIVTFQETLAQNDENDDKIAFSELTEDGPIQGQVDSFIGQDSNQLTEQVCNIII